MDQLPPEILRKIIAYLGKPLAPYASINREFQTLVESFTFAAIETTSADIEVAKFEDAFSVKRRRDVLKRLELFVELPARISDEQSKSKPQSQREDAEKERIFTLAVHRLFHQLSSWNGSENQGSPVPLHLSIISLFPRHYPQKLRNVYKYITLGLEQALPQVQRVTSVSVEGWRLHPTVLVSLVAALPSLRDFEWGFRMIPRRMKALWHELRKSMALLVTQLSMLTELESIDIHTEDDEPLNQSWAPPALDESYEGDELSAAIWQLSKLSNLRRLDLGGLWTFSPTVFDPVASDDDAWPSLRELTVCVSILCYDGRWYFTGDESLAVDDGCSIDSESGSESDASEISSDSHRLWRRDFYEKAKLDKLDGKRPCRRWRKHPDPAIFDPLIVSMIRAVLRMPQIQKVEFEFPGVFTADIVYYGRGCLRYDTTLRRSIRQETPSWKFHMNKEREEDVGANWDPPAELVQVLQMAGHELVVKRGSQDEVEVEVEDEDGDGDEDERLETSSTDSSGPKCAFRV